MNRQGKEKMVALLREKIIESQATFIVDYKGLSVVQMEALRTVLRSQGGTLKVTKARLMKKAVEGVESFESMIPYFKNQIGIVFAQDEAPGVAKGLRDFAKENEALDIVVGSLDAQLLDKEGVIRIASLPTKEVLLAQVCGTLNAPIASFTRVLHTLIVRLLWVLKKVEEQKQIN